MADYGKSHGSNEQRFNLADSYDKSLYLSKVRRVKGSRDFQTYCKRNPDLIQQAGDCTAMIDVKNDDVFSEKKDLVLDRKDKGVANFKSYIPRKVEQWLNKGAP